MGSLVSFLLVLILVVWLLPESCSDDYTAPSTVALAVQWCEPHGGLRGVKHRTFLVNGQFVEAVCNDETHIARQIKAEQ